MTILAVLSTCRPASSPRSPPPRTGCSKPPAGGDPHRALTPGGHHPGVDHQDPHPPQHRGRPALWLRPRDGGAAHDGCRIPSSSNGPPSRRSSTTCSCSSARLERDRPAAPLVGRVIGTEDATPLEFWVAVATARSCSSTTCGPRAHAARRATPSIYGVVGQVRARHEGARFDCDVFLDRGRSPAGRGQRGGAGAATRFEPEVFVPPLPGAAVPQARRRRAPHGPVLRPDGSALPAGLSRDDEALYLNLEFLDGTSGAHVNISGISGVATKTSYATFLLYSLFHSGVLGAEAVNAKALVFNVKGEDLLFLDQPNGGSTSERRAVRRRRPARGRSPRSACSRRRWPATAAPARRRQRRARASRRSSGPSTSSASERLLPFLFADAEDDRQQYTMVVHRSPRGCRPVRPGRRGCAQHRRPDRAHLPRAGRAVVDRQLIDEDAPA